MLCQSCKERDANVHLKRIIAGETDELHLCAECAALLGYSDFFSGVPSEFSRMFGISGRTGSISHTAQNPLSCDICGFSFEDISRTGRPGCPNCYRVFADRLTPGLIKLHGRATYRGKFPNAANGDKNREALIAELKTRLNTARKEGNRELYLRLKEELDEMFKGDEL